MPFTTQDLNIWEQQGDIDKFRQILTYLTEEQYIDIRLYAVKALGRMGNQQGLRCLLRALNDIKVISDSALEELRTWGAEDINSICEIAEDPTIDKSVRRKIIKLLAENPCERVVDTFITLLGRQEFTTRIQRAVREFPFFDLLKPKLEHPSPVIRYSAIQALAKIADQAKVFSCLLTALDDEDPQVRCLAAEIVSSVTVTQDQYNGLGIELSHRTAEVLITHLADEDFMVRSLSANALAPIADQHAMRNLKILLGDPYATVRMSAVVALSNPQNKELYKRLVRSYQTEDNVEVRSSIIHAIASTGHKESFGFLKTIIESEDEYALKISALESIIITPEKQPAIDLLIEQLDVRDTYLIDTVLRIFYQSDINPPIEKLIRLIDVDIEILDDRTIHLILNFFYKLRERRTIESLLRLMDKEVNEEIAQHTIWLIVEILKPTPIEDYLSNLPSSQDGIYRIGVQKIKNYLDQSDES